MAPVRNKYTHVIFSTNEDEEGYRFAAADRAGERVEDFIKNYLSEYDWDEEEIEIYELGRRGILPQRTIVFVKEE